METKNCSVCEEEKPLSEFYARQAKCKPCHRSASREYNRANRDSVSKNKARYYQDNREAILETRSEYASANPEKIRAKNKSWYEANADYAKSKSAEHKRNNRARYTDYEHQRRARKRSNGYEAIDRDVVYERDSGLCYLCGDPVDVNNWHLDHVTPIAKGGSHTYDNVRVTHPKCNLAKGSTLLGGSPSEE